MVQPYHVEFSHEATNDLEAAIQWIKEDSIEAAEAFFYRLRNRCEIGLSSTPHMGVVFTLADETKLLALTCGTYRVFYMIDEDSRVVTLIRILHTSRDVQAILGSQAL